MLVDKKKETASDPIIFKDTPTNKNETLKFDFTVSSTIDLVQ